MSSIRILVVDNNEMVVQGITIGLKNFSDFELVGKAYNGEEAINLCEELQPDIILMDVMMPVMDGATATRIITEKFPDVKVLALTSFDDENTVQTVLDAGATSFLYKEISMQELAKIIRQTHEK